MGADVHFHPLLPFHILLVPEALMVKRPVIRVGQCQDTAEGGQYQENATECQGSTGILEATLWRSLRMGIHQEVPTALAEGTRNSKSRFREERPRTEDGSEFRDEELRRNFAEGCPCHLGNFKLPVQEAVTA